MPPQLFPPQKAKFFTKYVSFFRSSLMVLGAWMIVYSPKRSWGQYTTFMPSIPLMNSVHTVEQCSYINNFTKDAPLIRQTKLKINMFLPWFHLISQEKFTRSKKMIPFKIGVCILNTQNNNKRPEKKRCLFFLPNISMKCQTEAIVFSRYLSQ